MAETSDKRQMTFNFEPGISTKYPTVRRYVEERIDKADKRKEYIAADMLLSPSCLKRKLAQYPGDKRTFGTDDLCKYMDSQNDYTPLLWFIDKYGEHLKKLQDDEIRSQIENLQMMLSRNS